MTPVNTGSGELLLVHHLLDARFRQHAEQTALTFLSEHITYKELDKRSRALADRLDQLCVAEPIIGINTSRSIDTIIGVLAILRSGRAYLPLDPTYPLERILGIVKDARIKTCLDAVSDRSSLNDAGIRMLSVKESNQDKPYPGAAISHSPVKSTGQDEIANPSPLAYILYTSGSTGSPKGVSMGHRALVNLLNWQARNSISGTGSATLQFAPLSFDVSFQEIFSTFWTGGRLVLIDDDTRLDPLRLLSYIKDQQINRLFLPFVALQQLAESAGSNSQFPASLREVMTAGEQLKVTPQLIRLFEMMPGCQLYNQYGPTEAHVVTQFQLQGKPGNWPALPGIGTPISNVDIYIVDENKLPVRDGEAGELIICGVCLAEGYLNQPQLTAAKFIKWTHGPKGPRLAYLSGDLARYMSDGNIEYLGRKDDQVKIRGHRVEPGEIEVILTRLSGVEEAVVVAREDRYGQKRLLAYVKSSSASLTTSEIRTWVESNAPQYMVPSAIMMVESFPKTSSGKVDKKALPEIAVSRPDLGTAFASPVSKTEIKIAEIWCRLLDLDRTGVNDNFFELGGNSLLAVKTVVELRERHGLTLPVTKLYSDPTIKAIAGFLDEGEIMADEYVQAKKSFSGDIAVIGIACRFPGAANMEEYWKNLVDGKESISFFTDDELDAAVSTELRTNPLYVKARGVLGDAAYFDASFFGINPKAAALMDPQQRVFLEISWEVLEQAGYLPSKYKGSVGVFAGSGNNTYYLNNVQSNTDLVEQVGAFQVMTSNEKDYIATRTAFQLNLTGPAISLNTGCSTSLLAISQAVENIRAGRCDVAIAGGVAITSPIASGHLFEEGAMLSSDGHCRPFDAASGGTVFSDGAGVVLLKPLSSAITDGDKIFAVIKGIGINNDGGSKSSFTAPSAKGQAGAIRQAINDAGVSASDLSYIEAHGTATPLGDPIEIEGLKLAFGQQAASQYCAIGSVKSNFGHLTAAAGVAGFIKTVLAIYHQQIPPSLNYNTPNPEIDFENSPFFVNTHLRSWTTEKKLAGVSSFGVGGTNVHIVIGEAPVSIRPALVTKPAQILQFSAKTEKSLAAYAVKLADYLAFNTQVSLPEMAISLRHTRHPFNHRRFVIAEDHFSAIAKLKTSTPVEQNLIREDISQTAFVFPGQGSQFINMGAELYASEEVFKAAMDECADLLFEFLKEDIRTIIFPNTSTGKDAELLNNTRYTQPAMFVFGFALAKLWISWGVRPSVLVGHSIGEFVAAHLAGIFGLSDALKLVEARGRLMSQLPAGSMLSILSDYQSVQNLLPDDVSVSAINSKTMFVVAGPSDSVTALSQVLENAGIGNKKLVTSHAFHSTMMEPARLPFEELLRSVALNAPVIPIVSTVTGSLLTNAQATDVTYWSGQLIKPVLFADAVEYVLNGPPALFLEMGPRSVTTTLVKQQAGQRKVLAVASQQPAVNHHRAYYEILQAVGVLWLHGVDVNIDRDRDSALPRNVGLPSYAFEKQRFWVEPKSASTKPSGIKMQSPDEPTLLSVSSNPGKDLKQQNMRRNSLINTIKDVLEEASGFDMSQVAGNTGFIEAGLDSLLLTQVAITLRKRFSVPVSFRQLNEEFDTIERLADYYDMNLPPDNPTSDNSPTNSQPLPTNAGLSQLNELGSGAPQPVFQQHFAKTIQPNYNNQNTALDLIAQQMQLLAQQIQLLQGGNVTSNSQLHVGPDLNLNQQQKSQATNNMFISPQKNQPDGINNNPSDQTKHPDLSSDEVIELKKPFGATARIEKVSTKLTAEQSAFLTQLTSEYNNKTKKSKAYTQRHRSSMADPRVVSGFRPVTKEIVYPIVMNRSRGSRMWDLDGNEYIDLLNGFGSSLLGYQPDIIKKAMHDQIEEGYEIGPQHHLAGPVCDLICEFTGADRAALCNTGSEAVLGAMRIARTVTGRSLIVAFSGSYHGIVDEVIVRGTKKLKTFPAAPGIMPEAVQNMLILEYGTDETLQIIRERAHELAAVLVEPVQSRRPEFQPIQFLKEVRSITLQSGSALIFDEVITGFRMHPGGAQALFGIKADLGTYGKVVGAGISIGVIAGTAHFMNALDGGFWQFGDSSSPEAGVTYFAGTFVRHPLALAASRASLEYMKAKGPALQESINAKTSRLADGLNTIFTAYGLPIYVAHFGSLWKIKYREEIPYSELLFTLMRSRGFHILDNFPCFLTEAHTIAEIDECIQAFKTSVAELMDAGFFKATILPVTKEAIHFRLENQPPLPGARLGKDKDGNPAWIIANPDQPGQYLKLEQK